MSTQVFFWKINQSPIVFREILPLFGIDGAAIVDAAANTECRVNALRTHLRLCFGIGLLLIVSSGALYALRPILGLAIGLVYPGYFCDTRSLGSVLNVAGYDFEVSETACDVLAKDDAITIFVSETGKKEKTAVFKYDPGAEAFPKIVAADAHTARISLESISSIFFREDRVGSLSISYDIGRIYYPSVPATKTDER